MEGTFIFGNNKSMEDLGGTFIEIPKLISEVEIHNWIAELFSRNKIDKIVIELEKEPILSLQIAYHIRLSIEDIRDKALVPILFISKLPLNLIILQTEIYSQILTTKGVLFSEFELQSNKLDIEHLNGLNESEYLIKFLKIINIQPNETIGRHSLANIWGAYAMDKASNSNALSVESEFKKSLYFKYISAFNNIHKLKASRLNILGNINVGNINKIKAEKKKILLIDDEASKGWETVLRKVIKTTSTEDFVVINEKVKGFESLSKESKRIIESEEFDLYLVDLRLNGVEEDENIKTEDFSGMKVLKKIKSINKGNQVIVFTASNKVWNLKALLDAGADDYYMKESPEYNFSNSISEQNYRDFIQNVDKCFERRYLREIFIEWKKSKNYNINNVKKFIKESDTALDIAWDQIERDYLDFGFLTLFQCVEGLANKLYLIDDYNDSLGGEVTIDKTVGEESDWEWMMTYKRDKLNGDYFSFGKIIQKNSIKPTALYKISSLFKIKLQKDEVFLKEVGKLNKIRNEIAHGGTKRTVIKEDLIKILNIIGEMRSI
jgi:DNA-binding NarL/FixJ family response regulator